MAAPTKLLRMQTKTKKKSPVLQLRPPVPVMPHLGSTGWREEGVWLIQSLVRFDSKSKKLSLIDLPSFSVDCDAVVPECANRAGEI